jgi:hypothetical protein
MPYTATCHCGATRVEVDRLPETVTRCNCSWCARAGGLWGYYAPEEVRVLAAPSAVYAPHVLNEHHFCGTCSGLMFNLSPKWTEENATSGGIPEERQYGLNMRMIDDDAVRALPVVELDGRSGW